MWVGQAVWWALLINAFAHPELFSDNTYAEDYMMGKGMFTAGIGFALILYISTSAWCIHSGEAGRCRTAKRTGTVVEDETRRNDDVELQSIDRPQRIRNSRG